MQVPIKKPSYDYRPIGTIAALSRCLNVHADVLLDLAERSNSLYREASRKLKPDGTYRITYDAAAPLKAVQDKILKKLLRRVIYPEYIQGGIRDINQPRSPSTNAAKHQGSKVVINIDVSRFYPSVKSKYVFQVWHGLFGFSPHVSEVLTKLTTLHSMLPEGAKTSSYLANLVFWRREPALAEKFSAKSMMYTRYIDDMSISSKKRISKKEIETTIQLVQKMLVLYDLRFNRNKLKVRGANERMVINNLTVNVKPSLPPEKRSSIRSLVHKLSRTPENQKNSDSYIRLLMSAHGKVNYLSQFHSAEGASLKAVLDSL